MLSTALYTHQLWGLDVNVSRQMNRGERKSRIEAPSDRAGRLIFVLPRLHGHCVECAHAGTYLTTPENWAD